MSLCSKLMSAHCPLCPLLLPHSSCANCNCYSPMSISPQLGPNPSFVDGEKLGRGQSGKLSHGGTLYLVNQSHPFALNYSLSSNGITSSTAQRGLKAADKTKGGTSSKEKEAQSSPTPKRNIKDFFPSSPVKVNLCDVLIHASNCLQASLYV